MEKEELSIEDRMILIEDQVNYALNKINELEKNIGQLTKDSAEHLSKILQLDIDMTEITNKISELEANYAYIDKETQKDQGEQKIQLSQIKTEIYNHQLQIDSSRELINALFDALNLLVESINSIRDRKQ